MLDRSHRALEKLNRDCLYVTRAMDAKLANLKAEMDLTRTWVHVDMDAFFASVEELDDPSLVRVGLVYTVHLASCMEAST